MKILGIMASPRLGGNVDRLLDKAMDGAASEGAEVVKIVISEKNILPCNGCMVCRNTGQCVIEDDMQEIYKLLYSCDAYIIGSPVYHQNVSCYLKNFFDRVTGTIVTYRRGEKSSRLPRSRLGKDKRALVVTSMNAAYPISRSYIKNFRRAIYSFTDYARIGVIGFVGTQNTWLKTAEDFSHIDQRAYEYGRRLVSHNAPLSVRTRFAWKDIKESTINNILDKIDPPMEE